VAKKTEAESPLKAAVLALDDALTQFEQLTAAAERVPLTSQRNLDKAAHSIDEAAAIERRVGEQLGALIAAIEAARKQHDADAIRLLAVRDKLQARTASIRALLERFGKLGEEAAEISGRVRDAGSGKPSTEAVALLGEVAARMERVVEDARALGKEAQADQMDELARQCDALRQQLQAALNKVTLLREKIAASIQ
jgi:chromosome segregation ATPase